MITLFGAMLIAFVTCLMGYLIGRRSGEADTKAALLHVMYEHEKAETQPDRLDILRCAIRYVEEMVWANRR